MRRTACLLIFAALPAYGQTAIGYQLDPTVIVPGKTATLLLQIQVAGSPSRVTYESLSQPGVEIDMKDDGSNGDRVAGDKVYTISLAAGPIVSAMRADDVYRPAIGLFYLYNGDTRAVTGGLNAEIADPSIERLTVTKDADDVRHTDYVVNIRMPSAFPLIDANYNFIGDQTAVMKRFYQLFPDDFDVANVVYIPSYFHNRAHYLVRNSVKGIGASQFDQGLLYGSRARLRGITIFPVSYLFDGVDSSFQHEFGHEYVNYLSIPPVGSGAPHWPPSTMAAGIMGFNAPGNIGGDFSCVITADASGVRLRPRDTIAAVMFNDLDLYLMGLLAADQVGEQIVLNQTVPNHCTTDSVYTGTITRFNVADLIANPAVGPRIPSSATAQKTFRLANILVTRDGMLDDDAMAFYSLFAQRAELRTPAAVHFSFYGKSVMNPFAISTRGLGTMSTRITAASPAPGSGLRFVPMPPCRILETRPAYAGNRWTGLFGPPMLATGTTRSIPVTSSPNCSLPASARAFVFNVTLDTIENNTGPVDFVTIWPTGDARPDFWTARTTTGGYIANSAIVKAGVSGSINVYSSNNVHMLLDINGYFTDDPAAPGLLYYPIGPCRAVDTRDPVYSQLPPPFGNQRLGKGETRTFRMPGSPIATPNCQIPPASAYSLQMTLAPGDATNGPPVAFVTAWPAGQSQPPISNLNSIYGYALANSGIVPARSDGSINVYAYDSTNLILDVNGYFAADDGSGRGLYYFPVTQCRFLDTQDPAFTGAFGGPQMTPAADRMVPIPHSQRCPGLPSGARAWALNATVAPNGTPMPFLSMWPDGTPWPVVSQLNAFQGQTVSNSAIVPGSATGAILVKVNGSTHVALEVAGYFQR